MTVCVAAICDGATSPCIVGAADRMLTTGDIQFEPEQPKNVLEELETIYEKLQERGNSSTQEAQQSIKKYVQELIAQSSAKKQSATPPENVSGEKPANSKEA